MVRLPEQRQQFCVWIDPISAGNLRELLMSAPHSPCTVRLSFKLYEALLRMALAEMDGINVPLLTDEILLINGLVKNKHWAQSDAILLQTWQVAYERTHGQAFRATLQAVAKEDAHAVHQDRGAGTGEGVPVWRR